MTGSKKTTSCLIVVVLALVLVGFSINDIVRGYALVGPRYGAKHTVYRAVNPHAFCRATGAQLTLGTIAAVCGLVALLRNSDDPEADDETDPPAKP